MTDAEKAIMDAWEIQSKLYASVLDVEEALFRFRDVIQRLEAIVASKPSEMPQERSAAEGARDE